MDSLEAYERNYKRYQQLTQPQISAIKTRVSLFPHQQTSQIQADYQLTNTTDEDIKEIFITSPKALQKISLKGAKLTLQDSDESWHVYLFTLKKPLLPGQVSNMSYQLQQSCHPRPNGSCCNQSDFEPRLGYLDSFEISCSQQRKIRGLPVKTQTPTTATSDVHLTKFEAIVSTSPDQTATTSGQLLSHWKKHGRCYFHYLMPNNTARNTTYFSAHSEQGTNESRKWRSIFNSAGEFLTESLTKTLNVFRRSS
ncbi:MAG: hypothetical protein HRT35_00530 [Algicola sp.]|nr:hypothetical protein [Algicola sp.]